MKFVGLFLTLLLLTDNSFAVPNDPVVATVNGAKITKSIFSQEYRQALMFVSNKKVSKKTVINTLINRELGVQRAKKFGISSDPVVKRKLEDVMYHAQISKDLAPEFKKIRVTDSDVKKYYQNHKEYRTSQILFRVQVDRPKAQVQEAIKIALSVFAKLKNNPDKFSELANRYSQSSTAKNGGDVGFQPSAILAPEYFEAINGKKIGYITPPFKTQFGVHIVKVLAVKKYSEINMALYKKTVYDIKRDAIIQKYYDGLRRNAKITIKKDLL